MFTRGRGDCFCVQNYDLYLFPRLCFSVLFVNMAVLFVNGTALQPHRPRPMPAALAGKGQPRAWPMPAGSVRSARPRRGR